MANQSTQKYIDGEKDWITAMLASEPVVEGKSPAVSYTHLTLPTKA